MPLHLNLTHEIRSQERKRSRDPLRLGLYGIVAIVVLCAGYYMMRQHQVSAAVADADKLTHDWEMLEPKAKEAAEEQARLTAQTAERDHLLHRIEHRFYWAPVLAKFVESVPNTVQITRLDGSAPAVKDGARVCTLSLTGVATGTEPRATAEALRQKLRQHFASAYSEVAATFKTLEDGVESAVLNGRQMPTAAFAIQVTFKSQPPANPAHNTAATK
jgi:Tfp pilus assembly protein PilN